MGSAAFSELLDAALKRLEQSLTDLVPEVFVAEAEVAGWYASEERMCFLWRSCKVARCAAQLDGRLPDERLAQFILGAVFAQRIAPHLRQPRLDAEEMRLIERF